MSRHYLALDKRTAHIHCRRN